MGGPVAPVSPCAPVSPGGPLAPAGPLGPVLPAGPEAGGFAIRYAATAPGRYCCTAAAICASVGAGPCAPDGPGLPSTPGEPGMPDGPVPPVLPAGAGWVRRYRATYEAASAVIWAADTGGLTGCAWKYRPTAVWTCASVGPGPC